MSSPSPDPHPPTPDPPVGWGVVGCGWVARDHGGPGIAASGNGRVVACHDRDAASAKRFAEGLASRGGGVRPRRPASLNDFLADPAVEAVYVATPNHAHRPVVEACAAAGKAVLCEKPLAHTVPDAAAMLDAVRAAGVPFATAFDQRFHPAHVRARDLVAAGGLGTVTQVRLHYACWLPPDWSPHAGTPHDNWRVDAARAGGGAAVDLAPHGVDLIPRLLGRDWESLVALTQTAVHGYPGVRPVDDGAVLAGRLGDTLASLHVGYNCPDALPRRRLELIGTRATLVLENTLGQAPGGTATRYAADGRVADVPFDRTADPFAAQARAFAAWVRDRGPFPFDPADDLRRHALLLGALGDPAATGGNTPRGRG